MPQWPIHSMVSVEYFVGVVVHWFSKDFGLELESCGVVRYNFVLLSVKGRVTPGSQTAGTSQTGSLEDMTSEPLPNTC